MPQLTVELSKDYLETLSAEAKGQRRTPAQQAGLFLDLCIRNLIAEQEELRRREEEERQRWEADARRRPARDRPMATEGEGSDPSPWQPGGILHPLLEEVAEDG